MLTENEIKRIIDNDSTSEKKRFARIGQKYYEGNHDILNYRMFYYNKDGELVEDRARANSRICHPFFTELVDQFAAYMLSFEDNPIRAKETAEGLQEHLDTYFDDDFWAEVQELIAGTYTKGFEYLYAYKNDDDRIAFECADGLGVAEVKARDASDKRDHVIYWYIDHIDKDNKAIRRIQVHDKNETYYYMQNGNGKLVKDTNQQTNPKPNVVWTDKETGTKYGAGLGYIPFWRLDNNRKQISGLKPIKALIDDYDLMECGLSNNLQDFDKPIHLVKGFQGDDLDELQQNIKTKKILGVDEGGGMEILTVDIPYQARKTKADEDEKNIYRFGMGFNSSQSGDGNVTNVVIRSRYTLLDLKSNKFEKPLKRLLKKVIRIVVEEINAVNGTDYQYNDVKIHFDRIIPTNDKENAEIAKIEAETDQIKIRNILDAAVYLGDEEVLKALCDILGADFDELKGQLEKLNEAQNTADAQALLNGVVVTDEQTAEISTETIPE